MEYHKVTLTFTVKVCSRNEADTLAHDAMLKILDACDSSLIAEDGFYIRSKTRKRKLVSPFQLK